MRFTSSIRIGIIGFGAICAAVAVRAQEGGIPVYRNEPSGNFMRSWLVCGPFPNAPAPGGTREAIERPGFETDYLVGHGGEAKLRVSPGQEERHAGTTRVWSRYDSPEDVVDLDAAISTEDDVVGYAYCEIEADAAGPCVLALGTNDGVAVWWNGERVWSNPRARTHIADGDLIPVLLERGTNRLLLKIEERGGRWRFICRLLPFEAGTALDRMLLFRVEPGEANRPILKFHGALPLYRNVIPRARLRVVRAADPEHVVWKGQWRGTRETALPIKTPHYDRFLLYVDLAFTTGVKRTIELPFFAGEKIEHNLFRSGTTDYAIVVSDQASDSEKWAARELQYWLKECSGADFPIRGDAEAPAPREIVIGWNAHTQKILGKSRKSSRSGMPHPAGESFIYANVGPHLLIWGGRDRGTMYGVMSFLERELGCRWYTPRVSVTPKRNAYRFTWLHHQESPGVRVRNDFYFEAFDPIWAARNRVNGAMGYREQPGGIECYWGVHTFYPLMPPEEFFAEHPEYYSLIKGRRIHDHAQLCLTNPDVLRIMTERIRAKMRENPEYLIYDVSQNDWHNPCQCDNCQAIAQREGSESGVVVWFVNQIAEQIEDEFPGKFIGTLAYQYTRKPPKTIKPRENVVIRLCSIECCFAHDFMSCPENASFVEDMKGWAAIAPHLYIWDYVVNFSHYIMPYPNFRVLQPNIQFFRDHNAIGIMEQAAYQSRGGEFAELRAYVISRLLWDPECDVQEVINDFMYGYYGRAGQYVRAYFDLLHAQLTPDTHIHLGLEANNKLFSDAFVRDAEGLFDKAERVADTEEIRQRVEMARLPIMYLKCKRTPAAARQDGTYQRFRAIVEREGITHYAEAGAPHREAFHAEVEGAK